MNTQFSRVWNRLRLSRKYRDQFVHAQAGRAFAFQIRAIMKRKGITQEELAERSGLTQGVISRAADPNYGKLTTTVKVKIANGLDMAYLGVLLPFSDAVKWFSELSEESVQVKTFEEEEALAVSDLGFADPEAVPKPVERVCNAKGIARVEQYGDAEMLGSNLTNQQIQAASL